MQGDFMFSVDDTYHQVSSISGTTSHNLNVSRLVLQQLLHNLLKPDAKSIMKM